MASQVFQVRVPEDEAILVRNEADRRGVAPALLMRAIAIDALMGPTATTAGQLVLDTLKAPVTLTARLAHVGGMPSGPAPVPRDIISACVDYGVSRMEQVIPIVEALADSKDPVRGSGRPR